MVAAASAERRPLLLAAHLADDIGEEAHLRSAARLVRLRRRVLDYRLRLRRQPAGHAVRARRAADRLVVRDSHRRRRDAARHAVQPAAAALGRPPLVLRRRRLRRRRRRRGGGRRRRRRRRWRRRWRFVFVVGSKHHLQRHTAATAATEFWSIVLTSSAHVGGATRGTADRGTGAKRTSACATKIDAKSIAADELTCAKGSSELTTPLTCARVGRHLWRCDRLA